MSGLTIQAIKTHAVLAPLVRPITTAVASIEKAPLLLIDVETKEGIIGHSYLFTYTPIALEPLSQLISNIAATLIGKSTNPAVRFDELAQIFRLLGRQGLVSMAIAGLDMAFWDAQAKAHGTSVAELLGAGTAPLACYDSHGIFDAERDRALLEASLKDGFKAVKFKIGGGSLADDVATLQRIREIIGPHVALMVDYNQSLSAPEAVRRIGRFDGQFDLDWVEEPVPAEDFAGYRTVRENVRTALQTGENWWMPDDAARAISARISDHAMLDIMKIGGLTGWLRASPLAQAASMPVSSHIFVEASAHAMAATSNRHLIEYLDVAAGILAEPYEIKAGALTPKGPGLGISWDPKAVEAHRV